MSYQTLGARKDFGGYVTTLASIVRRSFNVEDVGKGSRGENARHVDRIVLHRCPLSDDRPNDHGAGTPREAAEVLILQSR